VAAAVPACVRVGMSLNVCKRGHNAAMPRRPHTVAERVAAAQGETRSIDFKEHFDPKELSEWLELIKDLVAMANSGGGLILIGSATTARSATGTPSWPANFGSLASVSVSVSYSMNTRSDPCCAVLTDLGGMPLRSW
jgi:hypothetical protein